MFHQKDYDKSNLKV